MGIREKEEARKAHSVVSVIAGIDEPKLGRPKSDKEVKKTVSLTIDAGIWEDLQCIARIQGISTSVLVANLGKQIIAEKQEQLKIYKTLR